MIIGVFLKVRSIFRKQTQERLVGAFILMALLVREQEIHFQAVAGGKDHALAGVVLLTYNLVGMGKTLTGEGELFPHLDGSGIVVYAYNL